MGFRFKYTVFIRLVFTGILTVEETRQKVNVFKRKAQLRGSGVNPVNFSLLYPDKNEMSKEQSFVTYEQKAFAYHGIYKRYTSSLIHCAFLCVNNPSCKSVNYRSEVGKEEGECELNDATAKDFPMHLRRSASSTYSVPAE